MPVSTVLPRIEDDRRDLPALTYPGPIADEEAAARAVRVLRLEALPRIHDRLELRGG